MESYYYSVASNPAQLFTEDCMSGSPAKVRPNLNMRLDPKSMTTICYMPLNPVTGYLEPNPKYTILGLETAFSFIPVKS